MPSFEQLTKQATAMVGGLSGKQRLMLAGAAVVTVAVLALFVHLIATPDYKPLMTDMEPADAKALAQKLAAKNISYEISTDGRSINVPSDKLDTSRMEIASDGMTHSGRLGFELFYKMNLRQTGFEQKVNYQKPGEDHFMVVGLLTFGFVSNKTTTSFGGVSQVSKTNSFPDADHFEFRAALHHPPAPLRSRFGAHGDGLSAQWWLDRQKAVPVGETGELVALICLTG